MVVHPGHGNYTHTLLNGLAWHLGLREEVEQEDIRMGRIGTPSGQRYHRRIGGRQI